MVVLLARLHLIGFLWGDVSLSNTLFRRDAGAFAAYLVDAETGELHDQLSDGQREHDLAIARTNLFGEFCDLEAGGLLDAALDPLVLVETIESRYRELWAELTGAEEFDGTEMHRIESRVRRLNALGFDVAELDITTDFDGSTIRIQPKVVDAGHHSRRLIRLTGLDTEENQARRLLNDLDSYRARTDQQNADEAIVAHQWLTARFEPVVTSVPGDLRGKLEPAELYHEVLEHRWFLSEDAGRRDPDRRRRVQLYARGLVEAAGRADRTGERDHHARPGEPVRSVTGIRRRQLHQTVRPVGGRPEAASADDVAASPAAEYLDISALRSRTSKGDIPGN